ncbi:MAG: CcdB family protein [Gammaproteobacteria bacterium]|jgi:toxin CcdB
MAQFDVCRNPNPDTQAAIPYLLEVQSDLLESIATCVVVPLVRTSERKKPAKYLNPCLDIEGTQVIMLTEQIAGIPRRALSKRIASLSSKRQEIMTALDFLFSGF